MLPVTTKKILPCACMFQVQLLFFQVPVRVVDWLGGVGGGGGGGGGGITGSDFCDVG